MNIYMDHAATTPLDRRVLDAMLPYMTEHWGNPSSYHSFADAPRQALDWARHEVADVLHCRPGEVVFTSGGSEGDSTAIVGAFFARRAQGSHIITSSIEHHAVLHACTYLEREHGARLTVLPVDRLGLVNPDDLSRALSSDTALVSIMYANNEVGTVQPIAAIAALCRAHGVPLHVDAVQAAGLLPLDTDALGASLLTLSGHKCYGPRGTGVLYVRRGTALHPLIHGGGQERGRRAGTEPVANAVGMATALRLAEAGREQGVARLLALRNRLINGALERVPGALLTGHPTERLAGSTSFCFAGVEGEAVLLGLDEAGIACSSGSACAAGSSDPSHVLLALGYTPALAHTAVRLTLGASSTAEQVDAVLDALPAIVGRLRDPQGRATLAAV